MLQTAWQFLQLPDYRQGDLEQLCDCTWQGLHWSFPKKRYLIGSPLIRILAFGGLYRGSPFFGRLPHVGIVSDRLAFIVHLFAQPFWLMCSEVNLYIRIFHSHV